MKFKHLIQISGLSFYGGNLCKSVNSGILKTLLCLLLFSISILVVLAAGIAGRE
jgi:hypothetical protein